MRKMFGTLVWRFMGNYKRKRFKNLILDFGFREVVVVRSGGIEII